MGEREGGSLGSYVRGGLGHGEDSAISTSTCRSAGRGDESHVSLEGGEGGRILWEQGEGDPYRKVTTKVNR